MGLLGADLIGFHIPLHCNNFLDTVDRALESRTDREHMTVRRGGHTTAVRPYPVSVAFSGGIPSSLQVVASNRERDRAEERRELLSEFGVQAESIAVGVDRLDYTKGIVERLLAIEELLVEHPWHRDRLTMVQIAAPSRTRIPSYADLRRRVDEEVRRINQRFQTARWKPIVLIDRHCNHEEVNRWYRIADICMVTSLHDGMNLVAKEFVAARDDEDGVLVLSKFTGAAVELRDALMVNPYDIAGVAQALHRGLEMPREEQRLRMQEMRRTGDGTQYLSLGGNDSGRSARCPARDLRLREPCRILPEPIPIDPTAKWLRESYSLSCNAAYAKIDNRLRRRKALDRKEAKRLEAFFCSLQQAQAPLLLLDYDGTLADFRIDRFTARPWAGVRKLLTAIQKDGRTSVKVITGRPAARSILYCSLKSRSRCGVCMARNGCTPTASGNSKRRHVRRLRSSMNCANNCAAMLSAASSKTSRMPQ